jgi:hypothetical protein
VPAARRIECIARQNHEGSERIALIGGTCADGKPWSMSEAEAIREIEAGRAKFYCEVSGQAYLVLVARDAAGAKFLKAAIDADTPECLLRLPRCR